MLNSSPATLWTYSFTKARSYPAKQPTDWLSAIKQAGQLYFPAPLPASTTDPDDEMFVER